jgi:hypothetical protein
MRAGFDAGGLPLRHRAYLDVEHIHGTVSNLLQALFRIVEFSPKA